MDARLSKSERLSSVKAIDVLVAQGRYMVAGPLRCCYRVDHKEETLPRPVTRILVSVPKRFFKRAVKRNLLKRRIREAYRLQKGLLSSGGIDVMFVYASKEIADFGTIFAAVGQILKRINERIPDK